jgi:hypothetical protein
MYVWRFLSIIVSRNVNILLFNYLENLKDLLKNILSITCVLYFSVRHMFETIFTPEDI